jgi:DNA-binding transcriptional MerR regulator
MNELGVTMLNHDKLFYTIGEVSKIVDVKPYVLRYWETEFKLLNPQKSVTGQRTYRKKDIQVALTIKRLLYDQKFTIAGAARKLEELEKEGLDQIDMFFEKNSNNEIENLGNNKQSLGLEISDIGDPDNFDLKLDEKFQELEKLIFNSLEIIKKYF